MTGKKKAIINSGGSLVIIGAQWLISVFIVRLGGYNDAGVFSLAMSISNVFCFFANYNIRNYQISDANGEFNQIQYFCSRVLSILISVLGCVVYLLIANGYSETEAWCVLLYLFYSNFNLISDIIMGTIQLRDHLEINGYSNMIRGVFCFVFFLGTYFFTKDMIVSLIAMDAATVGVTLIYDLRLYRRYLDERFSIRSSDVKRAFVVLKRLFFLMLAGMFPIITTAIPRRFIQLLFDEDSLGLFSTIFTPTVLITTLAPALILAIVPQITEHWKNKNIKGFLNQILRSYGICAGFTAVAEILALIAGRPFMKLLFGESILQYYDLLYYAILATGLNSMTSCGTSVLIAMRKKLIVTFSAASSCLVTFVFSRYFIENHFIYGAAYILIIAYAMQNIFQLVSIAVFTIRERSKQ